MSKIWTKEEVDKVFQENDKVLVQFTKKDGTFRDMICTLKDIPKEELQKIANNAAEGKARKKPSEVKNVWDTVVKQWRFIPYGGEKIINIFPLEN